MWNSSAVGKSQSPLSGDSRDPRQGTPYLGPRVQTCYLVLGLGDTLGVVGKKQTKLDMDLSWKIVNYETFTLGELEQAKESKLLERLGLYLLSRPFS